MNPLHIPAHIDMTRRIAAQQTADVTRLAVEEQQLKAEYDRHQAEYEAERARVEAELRKAAEDAKRHLDGIEAAGRRLAASIADTGQRLRQHADEAREAQESVLDWCTRRGISPDDLPVLADTGPLPVVQPLAENSQPLPVIPDPADLLALGKRMADPSATITDPPTGGEPPAPGAFQAETDRA